MSHEANLDKGQFRHNDVYKNLTNLESGPVTWDDVFGYAAHDHEEEARHVDEFRHAKDHSA